MTGRETTAGPPFPFFISHSFFFSSSAQPIINRYREFRSVQCGTKSWTLMKIVFFLLLALLFLTAAHNLGFSTSHAQDSSSVHSTSYGSATIAEYPLPSGSHQPWGIVADPSTGFLWFVEQSSNQIGSFDPATAKFSEYAIPTSHSLPEDLAIDDNHNVWVSELQAQKLGLLYSQNGTFVEFALPKGPENLPCGPIGVTPGPSSNVWITCEFSNQIDEFFPANSTFKQFNLPEFYSAPLQIVFDKSGNFWFIAADSNMLGYVTVSQLKNGTTNGINEFAPTNQSFATTITNPQAGTVQVSSLSTPSQMVLSPDGTTIWLTEHTASSFDSYNIQTKSLVKYWTSQTHNANYTESLPNGIAMDPNGNIWIAEHYGNKIAEFNPKTSQLTEYPIPCCTTNIAGTLYLAITPDGKVWFTEFYGDSIGVLTPAGDQSPVTLGFKDDIYNLTSNGNFTVPLAVSVSNTQSKSSSFAFDVSGITSTGALRNLSVGFTPSVSSVPSGTSGNVSLHVVTQELSKGTHYLTISAKDSANNVTYSTILKLNVSDPLGDLRTLLVEGLIVGIVASVLVIGGMIIYFRSRKVIRRRPRSMR